MTAKTTKQTRSKRETTVEVKGRKLKIREGKADRKADTAQMIKLYAQGKTQADIARFLNVSEACVSQRLSPYKDKLEELGVYQANKATFQDLAANRMLKAILEKDLEGEKLSSLGSTFKIMHEAERLTSGKSTSNVSLKVVDLSKYCLDDANSGS